MCKNGVQPSQKSGKKLGVYYDLCTYAHALLFSQKVTHTIRQRFYHDFPLREMMESHLLYAWLYRFYTPPAITTTLINNRRIA